MSDKNGTTSAPEDATPILTRIRHNVREFLPHRSGAAISFGPFIVQFHETYSRQVSRAFEFGRQAMAYQLGHDLDDLDSKKRPDLRIVR